MFASASARPDQAIHAAAPRLQEGEELTFDYASVTESEKEVRSAVCLCGSRRCRASYLTYLGASCFNLVSEAGCGGGGVGQWGGAAPRTSPTWAPPASTW